MLLGLNLAFILYISKLYFRFLKTQEMSSSFLWFIHFCQYIISVRATNIFHSILSNIIITIPILFVCFIDPFLKDLSFKKNFLSASILLFNPGETLGKKIHLYN